MQVGTWLDGMCVFFCWRHVDESLSGGVIDDERLR